MEQIKQNMLMLYYKNLEQHAKKNKIDIVLPKLPKIILETPSPEQLTHTENNTESENIYSEDFVYKKPWNKLNIIHKCIKMQEYVNNLNIDDPEMKKHLKNHLVTMIKNKKLTKKTDVEYDHINGKIISVPSLQYNNINV